MTDEEKQLWDRIAAIHRRVQWMADEEARSAWVSGPAAQGSLLLTKDKLISEAEALLDRIEAMQNADRPPRSG